MDLPKQLSRVTSPHPLLLFDIDHTEVPQGLVDRIKVNNILSEMRKGAKEQLHDVQTCNSCQCQEGEVMKMNFIRKCTNILNRQTLNSKIDNHLLENNSVSLIGQLAADLPRPTENSNVIWKKLLKIDCQ